MEHLSLVSASLLHALLRHFNCSGAQKVDSILALRPCPLEFLDISYTAVTMLSCKDSGFFGLRKSLSTLRTFICRGTQITYDEFQCLSYFVCPFTLLDVRDCPNLYAVIDVGYWPGQRIPKSALEVECLIYLINALHSLATLVQMIDYVTTNVVGNVHMRLHVELQD